MRIFSFIFMLVLLITGIAFSALNAHFVEINYLFGRQQMPVALLVVIAFALGVVFSLLFLGYKVISLKAHNKWLEIKLNHSLSEEKSPVN